MKGEPEIQTHTMPGLTHITTSSTDKKSTNRIKNSKYTLLTFVPKIIWLQHQHFSSIYFTLIMILQYRKEFSVSPFFSSFFPWFFVLILNMINEGCDDYKRHVKDEDCNSQKYSKLTKDGFVEVKSADLVPGDMIRVNKGDRIPADIVLLKSDDANSEIFIRTDQLDGETDWKRRVAPYHTQRSSIDSLFSVSIDVESPHKDIYSFNGALYIGNYEDSIIDNKVIFNKSKEENSESNDQPDSELFSENLNSVHEEVEIDSLSQNLNVEEDVMNSPYSQDSISEFKTLLAKAEDEYSDQEVLENDPMDNVLKSSHIEPDINIKISSSGSLNERKESVDLDNTLWQGTIAATTSALGLVIYTGPNTRASLNSNEPRNKDNKIERELDIYTLILALISAVSAGFYTKMRLTSFYLPYVIKIFIRFLILFSYVIPISLKVTINLARLHYSMALSKDEKMEGVKVRTTSMQEELGRISFLLSDKTGTLTKNEMEMKKVHLGTVCFSTEEPDFKACLDTFSQRKKKAKWKMRRPLDQRCYELAEALVVCHSVTPVETKDGLTYQASSPDEVAIVNFLADVDVKLIYRSRKEIKALFSGELRSYKILHIFPFSSVTKRMGIVVEKENGEKLFCMKGADTAMASIVNETDWADGATDNMAREGLRTLHVGFRIMPQDEYLKFDKEMEAASLVIGNRAEEQLKAQRSIENNLELIGLTGVEDKLQDNIQQSLESLKNAGISVWMLTGDKKETAISIAKSSKLFTRNQRYMVICNQSRQEISKSLLTLSQNYNALVIDGASMSNCDEALLTDLIKISTSLDAVVGCRLSPTQKADVARIIRSETKRVVCAIGDGGNDVSMINAADVGIGIEGKEGNQASTAADISVTQFDSICELLFWHGRRCYMNTACISQIILHRGIIISVIQGIFSALINFFSISLFQGLMPVLYIILTFPPLYAIAGLHDISRDITMNYPELYKELVRKQLLSLKNFSYTVLQSFLQGAIIMYGFMFFQNEFFTISVLSFVALVVNELIMVILSSHKINSELLMLTLFSFSGLCLCFKIFEFNMKLEAKNIAAIGIVNLISSITFVFIKLYMKYRNPSTAEKLMLSRES